VRQLEAPWADAERRSRAGCDHQLRRWHVHGLGGALPEGERQAAPPRFLQPRLDGECDAKAIGAQAAFPGRQVISLSGDGGFTMLMGDLLTLSQMDLPVKVVVFHNSKLSMVDLEMKSAGYLPTGTDLKNPNFAKMAEAVGILGIRVEDPADLEGAVSRALAHRGPALLDVLTNPQELSMPPKITLEQAYGFGLFALKAVLSGNGDELVELAKTNLLR
jgi:pyruvate dehydrogenase (quinone)